MKEIILCPHVHSHGINALSNNKVVWSVLHVHLSRSFDVSCARAAAWALKRQRALVMPLLVISISVSSNGNSPGIKMMGGMMLDMEKERNSHHTKLPIGITRNSQDKSRTRRLNHTMLSLNERYRRLIPYMTFYYANDGIVTTTADPINEIEIEKFPPGQIRFPEQPDIRIQDTPLYIPPRPPLVNLYESDDNPNVRYYYSEKDPIDTFKLIPYEQTPVQVVTENINLYNGPKHIQNIPNVSPTEQVYLKPRPNRPQHLYDLVPERQPFIKKPVLTVSDDYYNRPQPAKFELKTAPVVETGFKPIVPQIPVQTTESTFLSTTTLRPVFEDDHPVLLETVTVAPEIPISYKVPNYYQYVVDNPQNTEVSRDSSTLSEILSILQKSKSLPKPVTRENLGSSIRTLLQVLSELKAAPYSEAELPVLSTAKPFAAPPTPAVEASTKPATEVASNEEHRQEFHKEPYLATVNPPSQHLDDYPAGVVTSQKFPLPIQSDDEGGTPGRPGVDYPTLTIIPQTRFNCKTQRYKGFFADPETRCQPLRARARPPVTPDVATAAAAAGVRNRQPALRRRGAAKLRSN
ncbi:hypothetical protein EVAR_3041_1 [Eumeta japonica]|uniref:Uncharacterized protein n=1 Tax=Eumeta variegata TaxID=151549 RepID=A0A4C1SWJ8_EUMVA|nr:hypothetical protein EVAR_3041_1 [Eumeta japonica]